jgi:hypothetical protein
LTFSRRSKPLPLLHLTGRPRPTIERGHEMRLVAGTHLTAVAVFAVAGGAFALILHLLMPNG